MQYEIALALLIWCACNPQLHHVHNACLLPALTLGAIWCRQRLSNDSFSVFLQAIKELNSGKKTREETLNTASNIFGASNADLFGKTAFCFCCLSDLVVNQCIHAPLLQYGHDTATIMHLQVLTFRHVSLTSCLSYRSHSFRCMVQQFMRDPV